MGEYVGGWWCGAVATICVGSADILDLIRLLLADIADRIITVPVDLNDASGNC
jgi:hypothetical protein